MSLWTIPEIWRGQTLRGCVHEGGAMPEWALAVFFFLKGSRRRFDVKMMLVYNSRHYDKDTDTVAG